MLKKLKTIYLNGKPVKQMIRGEYMYQKPLKDPVRSLFIYNEYPDEEYQTFRLLSTEIEKADFYCNTYNKDFVILSRIYDAPDSSIPVEPNINHFSQLRIRTEIFGSTLASRHIKSAKILAHFFTDDVNSDIYPD
ncbi:7562_t:CDS:2 [Funneliformis geosporum]|nr:7562_t:CDS:2 [Funneliformis geosporum]